MPPKKNSGGQKVPQDPALILPDGGDPALVAMAIVDKKKRNLEKRKNKLESLRDGLESGTRLDKDQLAAVAKLDEVMLQLELVGELQKQFTTLQSDYQKSRKKQQKADRLAARESEREAERRAVEYTLRLQDILNNMGVEDKERFRTGTDGAVLLSEEELSQLDELYRILTPARAGNSSYQTELNSASDFIQQLMEQSTKEVAGTTYKQLSEMIQRIDGCGYFDRSPSEEEEEDSGEEGGADDDDYKSAEEALPTQTEGLYERSAGTPPPSAIVENSYIPTTNMVTTQPDPVATVVQANVLSGYVPSAPSPTFPGLGPSPLQPALSDGFSFMHDSEVDRGGIQVIQQPPTTLEATQMSTPSALLQTVSNPQITAPQMNFPQYPPQEVTEDIQKLSIMTPDGGVIHHPATNTVEQTSTQGDLATTDVTTGQPNQTTDTYQTALGNAGGPIMSSAPPSTGYQYGGGAVSDPSTGYSNQFGAPVRVSQPARGGRGPRRGGGPPGPKGGMYRNGRGGMQSYDMQAGGYGGRGQYSSSGGGYPRGGGGGRPNYRAPPGARK